MRNPGGAFILTGPDAPTVEIDTITCGHCNTVVPVPVRCDPADLGGFCMRCAKYVCKKCNKVGTCTPFLKRLEDYEQREARRRDLFRNMGLI